MAPCGRSENLVALFQSVPLVGLEEPETVLHPAAGSVMLECLEQASRFTQVIVTSHSADLLESPRLELESILAVVAENGVTRIGPLDAAAASALRDRLYSAGDLLRMNQLAPDPSARSA